MSEVQQDNAGAIGVLQKAQRPAVDLCRAVYEGTLRLREEPDLLPQFEKEEVDTYGRRLAEAVLFNATKKTIDSLTGIALRKNVELGEDVPDEILGYMENADLGGQHLDIFMQQEFRDKLIAGHTVVLVDWHGPAGARSKKEEGVREGLARPYCTMIRKDQVQRVWPRMDGGQIVLMQFAYEEEEIIRQGEFSQTTVKRSRQFDLVRAAPSGEINDPSALFIRDDEELPPEDQRRVLFRSWIQKEKGGEWVPDEVGKILGERMIRIPVVADYAVRTGFFLSEPPFLDLVLENIKHWQIRSDRDQNLHVASVPIFVVYGADPDKLQEITVASAIGLSLPADAKAEYVEAQGTGLQHTQQELLDIQKRMASLGLSMLEERPRQVETAKAVQLGQKAQDSELANQARQSADTVEEILSLFAMWMGLEDGGTATIDTDYDPEAMTPELFDKFLKAVGEGRLSLETMWDRMVAMKLLPENFDPEVEKERIANQGTAELEAMMEQTRRLQEARGQGGGEGGEEEESEEEEEVAVG